MMGMVMIMRMRMMTMFEYW